MSEENLTDQGSTAEKTTTEAELEAQLVIEREVETSQEPATKAEALDATGKGSTASEPAPARTKKTARTQRARNTSNRRTRFVDESVPRIRREFRRNTDDYSYAYCTIPSYIYSDSAQQFFERNFQWVDRSLLVISLVGGAIGGPEVAKKYTQQAETLCKDLQAQLIRSIDELQRLMNAKKIPEETQVPGYDHKRLYKPAMHSPQAKQFVTLIELLDRIIARIEGAWINGVIDAEQRQKMIRAWIEACRKYVMALQNLRVQAMQEAVNAGKRQEVLTIEQRVERNKANEHLAEDARTMKGEEHVPASPVQAEKTEEQPSEKTSSESD